MTPPWVWLQEFSLGRFVKLENEHMSEGRLFFLPCVSCL